MSKKFIVISRDNFSRSFILFVYYFLKLPVIAVFIVVLVAFVSDFLVITILTGITTTAMTKIITILMRIIRDKLIFPVIWFLKRFLRF